MGFVDNPIITSPFDVPTFHYELDDEGQPTGAKLKDRRDSIRIVPSPPRGDGGRDRRSLSFSILTVPRSR